MSASIFDQPLYGALLGDAETANLFTQDAELAGYGRVEAAVARAQAEIGLIPPDAARAIASACEGFAPDMSVLAARVGVDGLAVPGWVAQVRAVLPEPYRAHFHVGLTSQDLIDTSLVLRLRTLLEIFDARLKALEASLSALERQFGDNALMARTRMQDALDTRAGTRLATWRRPLARHRARLAALRPQLLRVQLGGAVGDRSALGQDADAVVMAVAAALDLEAGDGVWHAERDGFYMLASLMAGLCGTLGKFGQDVALMALGGREQITLSGGGGSSAMPHKVNPVGAEILVSLARYAAGQAGTMGQALVHEQERSGAAWTLEWMVLPQLAQTTGAALLLAGRVAGAIENVGRAPGSR